jgi:hypothetical protein
MGNYNDEVYKLNNKANVSTHGCGWPILKTTLIRIRSISFARDSQVEVYTYPRFGHMTIVLRN